ncbi:MAG: hypothetical protein H8D34_01515 [Chloroflexi bacterium]|nr:hypothetical protein [Chloroflexota bacterium]
MKNTKSIINSMFSIPEPKGYERDRITKRIKISVFVITILGFVIFGFNVFTGAMTGVELIFLISLLPIQFITLYLLRKGYIIKAGIFEISISAIYLTPLVLFSGGSNSPYIIAYLGISLITGAILGWKAGVIFSVISVLLLGVIGSIGTKGLLPPS